MSEKDRPSVARFCATSLSSPRKYVHITSNHTTKHSMHMQSIHC